MWPHLAEDINDSLTKPALLHVADKVEIVGLHLNSEEHDQIGITINSPTTEMQSRI